MGYYRLSEARVRRVLNMPMRVEEGVAPKTVAMMAPVSTHAERRMTPLFKSGFSKNRTSSDKGEKWSQEIWVMVQDVPTGRKIISAWRYPGVSKARSEITKEMMRNEFRAFAISDKK